MTAAIARDAIYRRRRFQPEIIELCVRWYPTYRLSYRDLVEMMAERGVTIYNNIVEQDHRAVKRRCESTPAIDEPERHPALVSHGGCHTRWRRTRPSDPKGPVLIRLGHC